MFVPQTSFTAVDSLLSWARSHGAYFHEQVEVYDDPQQGISLRVRSSQQRGHLAYRSNQSRPERQNLPTKSRIVSCPFGLSLSFLNALNKFPELQSHSPRFPALFFEVLEPHVIGHFFLIQQYLNVDISYWGPYIKSLPQPEESEKLGTPLYFTEADMDWIRGTDLEVARELREKKWKSDWEKGQRILDISSGWEKSQGKWTWDLYRWAATIFSSRSFISTLLPEEILTMPIIHGTRSFHGIFPVLFPLLDLANHSSAAKVTWFTNARNEPKDLSIISESEIYEGQQVFNNYAPKNNTELMLGYGFCLSGNDEVGIAFKPLREELMVIRRRQWGSRRFLIADSDQTTFHVRANPYARERDDKRLEEFALFEDGCVDTLSLLVANQREQDYMIEHPEYWPESISEEDAFVEALARNIFKVMSVLLEKLQMTWSKIESAGERLAPDLTDTPETSCQHAAKIYRDGQISVLKTASKLLQYRLDQAMFQHSICDHANRLQAQDPRFESMRLNVELITLECAFGWLQITYPKAYKHSIGVIAKVLEVIEGAEIDWMDLVTSGWDYTLWCFWIYVVWLLRFEERVECFPLEIVMGWIEDMTDAYNPDREFSGWPSEKFNGEKDEGETLSVMVEQIAPLILDGEYESRRILISIGDMDGANQKLMNLASTIAMEESFSVKVEMEKGLGKERVNQRVLFIKKRYDRKDMGATGGLQAKKNVET